MRPRRRAPHPTYGRQDREYEPEPRHAPSVELCARCDYWPVLPHALVCKPCERAQRAMGLTE